MSRGINRDRQQMTEGEKEYEKSIPAFVDKMTKLSMEEVKLPRDRDRFIQEVIRDKAWISEREGFPEYDAKFFNSAIKERRREIAEEQNPLLSKRQIRQEGGEIEEQMSMLMEEEPIDEPLENTMLPDEEMEEDYVEYVVDSILSPEDKEYLENALMEDAKLSEIFDQVIESATEFSGSGLIEGPGSERSDSIPARLSDGEFVLTAKATDEIGSDNLMSMMKDAEAAADERQGVAYGGYMTEREDETVPIQTSGLRNARRNVPQVAQTKRQVEEEMLKSSPRRFYQPISG